MAISATSSGTSVSNYVPRTGSTPTESTNTRNSPTDTVELSDESDPQQHDDKPTSTTSEPGGGKAGTPATAPHPRTHVKRVATTPPPKPPPPPVHAADTTDKVHSTPPGHD